MSSGRGLRHALKSFIPNWLSDRRGFKVAYYTLYNIALMADILVEVSLQGFRSPLPGIGTPTALPLIGQSRGLIQGLLESDGDYAARLTGWLYVWRDAGSADGLANLLKTYIGGPTTTVRVVDRAGNFVSANADGTTTETIDASWNWDKIYNPERTGWWSDIWIICYVDFTRWPVYTNLSDAAWLAAWGTYNGFGTGHQVPRNMVDGVNSIIAEFKGAHTFVESIVWTSDTTLFIPGYLAGVPDGTWGGWSKQNATREQVAARLHGLTTRYWNPRGGG